MPSQSKAEQNGMKENHPENAKPGCESHRNQPQNADLSKRKKYF